MVRVYAAPVEVPVDCLCVDNSYRVYGEEQPEKRGEGTGGDRVEKCFVTVDVDLSGGTDGQAEINSNAETEIDYTSGFVEGAKSIISPLSALFETSGLGRAFKSYSAVFENHTEQYHGFLDEKIFAYSIRKTAELSSVEEFNTYFDYEEGDCKSFDNPKPECVIQRAMCSYEKYVGVLFNVSGQSLADNAMQDAIENPDLQTSDIQTLLTLISKRDQALMQEAQGSQQALDQAIAIYAQFFQTYRLHLRFKEIIAALVKVRNVTSSLDQLVACLPNKFVGVATTKCN